MCIPLMYSICLNNSAACWRCHITQMFYTSKNQIYSPVSRQQSNKCLVSWRYKCRIISATFSLKSFLCLQEAVLIPLSLSRMRTWCLLCTRENPPPLHDYSSQVVWLTLIYMSNWFINRGQAAADPLQNDQTQKVDHLYNNPAEEETAGNLRQLQMETISRVRTLPVGSFRQFSWK